MKGTGSARITLTVLAALVVLPHRVVAAQGTLQSPTVQPGTALTLGDAIRLAAMNSAASQGARARVSVAEARVREQRAGLLPTLSADAMDMHRTFNTASFGIAFPTPPGQPPVFPPNGTVPPAYRNVDIRARVVQPLIDLSAISRIRAARGAVTASSAAARVAAEQAGTQAALAYIATVRASDDLRARAADSALAADLVGVARAQLQAGTGIALDVTRAQAQLAATRAQLIASRAARDRARVNLARALNIPIGTPLVLADSLDLIGGDTLPEDTATAIQRALANRPDLRAAEARVTAAQQGVSAIQAERLPSLSLAGDDGVNGLNYNHLLHTYEYSVQLTVPILDGFRREARVQEQEGLVREAEIQARDLKQQAAADVQSALVDLRAARDQVAATRDRLRLSEQEVAQARERFRAGVAGNADVITALLSLTTARTDVINSLTSYQTARLALARAEGAVTSLP